jgi:fermentation-respiration switch protein FrsA (DUF1100 family)
LLIGGFAAITFAGGVVAKRLTAGVTIGRVLGVAVGLAGIVLVVWGWRLALIGVRHGWVRILTAVAGTLLVAQFVLLPVAFALDATFRLAATSTGRTPADVGLPYEDVRFESADGLTIAAWWLPTRAGDAVVVLPGAGSTRESALDHAALLHRAGLGALVLDLRGHGESEGPRNEFGWGAERDVIAAVGWLEGRPEVTGRIGVLGLSMGAEVALTAAALDPRIQAVVAEGASARTWDDARIIPDTHPIGLANEWVMFGVVELISATERPQPLVDAIAGIEAPVLLITGSEQHEAAIGPRFREANPDRVTLWALADTPHIGALRVHPDAYRDRVLGVLRGA